KLYCDDIVTSVVQKPASAHIVSLIQESKVEVSRPGVIPGPTVIVRMGESNGICRAYTPIDFKMRGVGHHEDPKVLT
ncbi:hypothetical protein, partial [Yersinia pestis]